MQWNKRKPKIHWCFHSVKTQSFHPSVVEIKNIIFIEPEIAHFTWNIEIHQTPSYQHNFIIYLVSILWVEIVHFFYEIYLFVIKRKITTTYFLIIVFIDKKVNIRAKIKWLCVISYKRSLLFFISLSCNNFYRKNTFSQCLMIDNPKRLKSAVCNNFV